MGNIKDIKQANIAIKEFAGEKGVSSGANMTHEEEASILEFDEHGQISGERILPNINDLESSVRDFVSNNKDNPFVNNPFNSDGSYQNTSDLATAYNAGLALSHWDDIISKHGDKINEVANKVDGLYEHSALSLGAASYIAESQGLNDRAIDLMLDKSINDYGFISSYKMQDTREMFNNGSPYELVKYALDKSTDETRYAIMSYLDANDVFVDKEDIDMISSVKSGVAALDVSTMINYEGYTKSEIKDVVSAANLYYDSLDNKDNNINKSTLMNEFMDNVRGIKHYEIEKYDIQRMEHPEIKLTDNQEAGIVFGNNKLTNFVKDYLDNPDSSNIYVHYNNKGLELEKPKSFEHIKIPSGLIDGPHYSKYGKYDVISVPFEDKFGKMTVSDTFVDRNGKTAVLSLPADRDRTVKFYDKESKITINQTFSVSDLKDIYNKNWEKLNARNKSLNAMLDGLESSIDKSPEFE